MATKFDRIYMYVTNLKTEDIKILYGRIVKKYPFMPIFKDINGDRVVDDIISDYIEQTEDDLDSYIIHHLLNNEFMLTLDCAGWENLLIKACDALDDTPISGFKDDCQEIINKVNNYQLNGDAIMVSEDEIVTIKKMLNNYIRLQIDVFMKAFDRDGMSVNAEDIESLLNYNFEVRLSLFIIDDLNAYFK